MDTQALPPKVETQLVAQGVLQDVATANGDRSVAIGGDAGGSTIITGNRNKVER